MTQNGITKVVHVGDFLKLKVKTNGEDKGEILVEMIEGKPEQSLSYWSSLGIRRATLKSPYKELVGKKIDSEINIDIPGGKTELTIVSILSSGEVREIFENIRNELEVMKKNNNFDSSLSEIKREKIRSLFN
jgi:molybdopterin-binding protein